MNDYEFGNFIYQLRTEKGLSQSQLGDMMGVSNKAVSKWEMGTSKPRPDMLIALASFFDVTVDELLAGRRNSQTKNQAESCETDKADDTALKRWGKEYRKKKRNGRNTIIMAFLLPILLFVSAGLIVEFCPAQDVVGPIVTLALLFAEAIDVALIFVFYGSARRLKRILYSTYPEQVDAIAAIISPKKVNLPMLKWEKICLAIGGLATLLCLILRIVAYFVSYKAIIAIAAVTIVLAVSACVLTVVAVVHYSSRCRREKVLPNKEKATHMKKEETTQTVKQKEAQQSNGVERKKKKLTLLIVAIVLVVIVAIIQVIVIADENIVYDPTPAIIIGIVFASILVLSLVVIGSLYLYMKRVKKLYAAFANEQYETVIKYRNCLLPLKKGSKARDILLNAVAVAYLEMQDCEKFLKYINKISHVELINSKFQWLAIYSATIDDYDKFAYWREQLQNSLYENDKEIRLKVLDLLYRHKKENYQLSDDEKESALKWKSKVLKSLLDINE